MKPPKNVINLMEVLKSGAKFDKPLIPNVGYYKLPVNRRDKLVILNVIYYRDEANGVAILAKDPKGRLKDFQFDFLQGVFVELTPEGEKINWKEFGYHDTPGCAMYCIPDQSFDLNGYEIGVTDEEISKMIAYIDEKEPAVADALKMVIRHIHGTYSDKYAKGQDIIDTKKMLYDKERGDFLNIYQVERYLQRYITQGSAKSHLIKDIEKAIHYLVFELTRRILMGDVTEIEPKV